MDIIIKCPMSKPKSHVKNSVCQMRHSETGPNKEELNSSVTENEAADSTTLNRSNQKYPPSQLPKQRRKNTSTAGSPQENKKKICKDKSSTSNRSTQTTTSLRTLPAGLISKEKRLQSYWTKASGEWSQKLWLPTGTGSVGSPGNTSNGCSNVSESISSSKINRILTLKKSSKTTSCRSSMFSLAGTTVSGGNQELQSCREKYRRSKQKQENLRHARTTKNNQESEKKKIHVDDTDPYLIFSKRFRLLPDRKQARIINDWIAATRKVRNCCQNAIDTEKEDPISEVSLRNRFVIAKQMSEETKKTMEWTLRTPKRIREYAVKDLVSEYKGNFTKLKKGQIKHFKMYPKSRLDSKQTINISHEATHIRDNCIVTCGLKVKISEDIPDFEPLTNMRLTRHDGNYYLSIPEYTIPFKHSNDTETDRIVSVDPGINIFGTYYSPDGEWGEIGGDIRTKLDSFYRKEKGIREKVKNKLRAKKAILRLNRKKISFIDDFQWKTVHWLLGHYKTIVIPRLYVSKSNKLIKQYQADIRHCQFVDRLIHKSMFYTDREIHVCKEHGTSSLCTRCQSIDTVKGHTVQCLQCGLVVHRDLAGARNILLKHLD